MNTSSYIPQPDQYKLLSGNALKRIAMVIMFIDHIGGSLLYRLMRGGSFEVQDIQLWNRIFTYIRVIGRSALPVFCFLLVEGFKQTHSVRRYAGRLAVFAIISEVPFDLAFYTPDPLSVSGFLTNCMKHQNIFLTLLIGLLTIWAMDTAWKHTEAFLIKRKWNTNLQNLVHLLIIVIFAASGGLAGYFGKVDYGWRGILVIVVLYVFYYERGLASLAGYAVLFSKDANSLPGFLLVQLYNGKRGKGNKYLFYLFYPVHLLMIYLLGSILLHMK